MDLTGYGAIPPILCHWMTFLAHALPAPAVPTFIELLVGAMLSRRGFVTEAWLAIAAQRHWTSYYKWLQRGRWSWVRLGQYLGVLLRSSFRRRVWYWVIDDTVICRTSQQAPDSRFHHNHARQVNRPAYLHGQCWVTLAVVLSRGRQFCGAIPLLSHLQRGAGQGSKLTTARVLIRALGAVFQELHVRGLLDSGYMRRVVIE